MEELKNGLKQHFHFIVENAITLEKEGLILTGKEAEDIEILNLISPNIGGVTHQPNYLIKYNDRKLLIDENIKSDIETIKKSLFDARKNKSI